MSAAAHPRPRARPGSIASLPPAAHPCLPPTRLGKSAVCRPASDASAGKHCPAVRCCPPRARAARTAPPTHQRQTSTPPCPAPMPAPSVRPRHLGGGGACSMHCAPATAALPEPPLFPPRAHKSAFLTSPNALQLLPARPVRAPAPLPVGAQRPATS